MSNDKCSIILAQKITLKISFIANLLHTIRVRRKCAKKPTYFYVSMMTVVREKRCEEAGMVRQGKNYEET